MIEEEKLITCLESFADFEKSINKNTRVVSSKLNTKNKQEIRKLIYLHNNLIAVFHNSDVKFSLKISDKNKKTETTKRKLNIILKWYSSFIEESVGGLYYEDHQIFQRNNTWYIKCFDDNFPFELLKNEDGFIDVNYHHYKKIIEDLFSFEEVLT